jgi:hypothetical protein
VSVQASAVAIDIPQRNVTPSAPPFGREDKLANVSQCKVDEPL